MTIMASEAPQTAERMTEAASDFLDSLDGDQRTRALLPFDDEAERQTWRSLEVSSVHRLDQVVQ